MEKLIDSFAEYRNKDREIIVLRIPGKIVIYVEAHINQLYEFKVRLFSIIEDNVTAIIINTQYDLIVNIVLILDDENYLEQLPNELYLEIFSYINDYSSINNLLSSSFKLEKLLHQENNIKMIINNRYPELYIYKFDHFDDYVKLYIDLINYFAFAGSDHQFKDGFNILISYFNNKHRILFLMENVPKLVEFMIIKNLYGENVLLDDILVYSVKYNYINFTKYLLERQKYNLNDIIIKYLRDFNIYYKYGINSFMIILNYENTQYNLKQLIRNIADYIDDDQYLIILNILINHPKNKEKIDKLMNNFNY